MLRAQSMYLKLCPAKIDWPIARAAGSGAQCMWFCFEISPELLYWRPYCYVLLCRSVDSGQVGNLLSVPLLSVRWPRSRNDVSLSHPNSVSLSVLPQKYSAFDPPAPSRVQTRKCYPIYDLRSERPRAARENITLSADKLMAVVPWNEHVAWSWALTPTYLYLITIRTPDRRQNNGHVRRINEITILFHSSLWLCAVFARL